jgi:hypothetical protein
MTTIHQNRLDHHLMTLNRMFNQGCPLNHQHHLDQQHHVAHAHAVNQLLDVE